MLEKGLPEILNVFTHFPEPDFSKGILQAIGYKEFWPYVKELNEDSLNISKNNLVTQTVKYAKYQIKWLNKRIVGPFDNLILQICLNEKHLYETEALT